MGQAFGLIRGSDGAVVSGSGNFTVKKTSTGTYTITFEGTFANLPVIAGSPYNQYATATVVFGNEWENRSEGTVNVTTGFTDQRQWMDLDYFSFIAMWP
ncbi:hypothetical protein [Polyangium spumosum]|uniref:H-type lectin domain-containing protein n=1 Tax=Polyangium spumosum TaxID=889282 RepID=A0A6N7Q2T2_9BACT|nr:hypothetical protein [Polyangium spumosum]MRG98658.1 hypothetical protein [Polyangium spumosum]